MECALWASTDDDGAPAPVRCHMKRAPLEVIASDAPDTVYNGLAFVARYATGTLDANEIVNGFQRLIDSGLAWRLQAHHKRTAAALIRAGLCSATPKGIIC